jgi:multidrug resistance efflux pump
VLDTRRQTARLAQLDARRAALEATLELKANGPRREEWLALRTRLASARADLTFAEKRSAQAAHLSAMVGSAEAERARALSADALTNVRDVESEARLLAAGARPEELRAVAAEIDGLVAERERAAEEIRRAQLVSPSEGTVVWRLGRRGSQIDGAAVKKGDELVRIFGGVPEVEAYVSEREPLDAIREGAAVKVKLDAEPDKNFTGRIRQLSNEPIVRPGEPLRYFAVRVALDPPYPSVRDGAAGVARIYSEPVRLAALVFWPVRRYLLLDLWSMF